MPEDDRLPDDRADRRGADDDRSRSPTASWRRSSTARMAYRLRNLIGFQPRLAPELGYGKAVHHVLRTVAEHTQATRRVPDAREIDGILDASFFLPTANKPAHRQLKDAAPAADHRRTPPTTPTTCTASGRPSGRSSCTSTASRSAGAPTSSSTRRAACRPRSRSSTTRPRPRRRADHGCSCRSTRTPAGGRASTSATPLQSLGTPWRRVTEQVGRADPPPRRLFGLAVLVDRAIGPTRVVRELLVLAVDERCHDGAPELVETCDRFLIRACIRAVQLLDERRRQLTSSSNKVEEPVNRSSVVRDECGNEFGWLIRFAAMRDECRIDALFDERMVTPRSSE